MNEKAREAPPHPGIHTVTDGTGAAVWVEKHGSQGACAYPITPSTNMGVEYAAAVGDGFRNLWGEPLVFVEPESEHSSASAAEGFASAGGQASTASFTGQMAKMSPHGEVQKGKVEPRKDIARIAMMHPEVFVAQTTAAHVKHFYDAISAATSFPGPSQVVAYTTCQPEHGVGDDLSAHQARLAVESRAYPLLVHDPIKGERLRDRLDLKGNPSLRDDWHRDKEGRAVDFLRFARSEGRFRRHFDQDGSPSPEILAAQDQVLKSWRLLQELAGVGD